MATFAANIKGMLKKGYGKPTPSGQKKTKKTSK